MPIAFPPAIMGHPTIQARNLIQKPFDYVPAPNLNNPGVRFMADSLGSGRGKVVPQANARSPGINFAKAYLQHDSEPRPQFLTDAKLGKENDGTLNMIMVGISRNQTGATLGNCTVMLFRTEDRSFIGETVSDGSGNWSMYVLKGGPFFLVEYKAGSPDLSGTSLNTLVPAQA